MFAKLTVRYGAAFMRQYADLDPSLVKADWAELLGGFHCRPDAIRYGLENLPPDRPPNAMQFRAMCNLRPDKALPALPAPESKPAPEVMARVAAIRVTQGANDPKAWAWRLKEREAQGPGLTLAQRQMWREALREELATGAA